MRWFMKNAGFELGDRDWSKGAGWTIEQNPGAARSGSWVLRSSNGASGVITQIEQPLFIRPGGIIRASMWADTSGLSAGGTNIVIRWRAADGSTLSFATGAQVAAGNPYTQTSILAAAPARCKSLQIGAHNAGALTGSMFIDDFDAFGDTIEDIPGSAIIRECRMIPADTRSAFDPLVGDTKFSEFNAGMSDRWAGVFTFVPALGADLGELIAFMQRIGKRERFFAFDANHVTPINGVVNGMVVDGGAIGGNTRIFVRNGPPNTTALVYGDYCEIGAQYFEVQRPLEIGPEGTGELVVWPSVRAAIADGEDIITDHPKMVARITSELDWRRVEADPVGPLSMSWVEYA